MGLSHSVGAVDGTWINMVLINGFTAGATTPQYMKDSRGLVRLRGLVVCPGAQFVCWVAPAGFTPNIQAGSAVYFDWGAGGNELLNPSRQANLAASGGLSVGMTSANVVGSAGVIAALDRLCWQS